MSDQYHIYLGTIAEPHESPYARLAAGRLELAQENIVELAEQHYRGGLDGEWTKHSEEWYSYSGGYDNIHVRRIPYYCTSIHE